MRRARALFVTAAKRDPVTDCSGASWAAESARVAAARGERMITIPITSAHAGAIRNAMPPAGPASARRPNATDTQPSHFGKVALRRADTPVPRPSRASPTTTGSHMSLLSTFRVCAVPGMLLFAASMRATVRAVITMSPAA